jgi:hypothetical protein
MANERVAEKSVAEKREWAVQAHGSATLDGERFGEAPKGGRAVGATPGGQLSGYGTPGDRTLNGETWKTCMVCDQPKKDGITVASDFFICTSCENEMVNTSVDDEKYPFFVRRLKPLWLYIDP